ncbi:MAG TPA: hypothetical protein VK907_04950, partial [Phnomibacter sp.]|nr:hypothetical protein [Phnomibacter sp.]
VTCIAVRPNNSATVWATIGGFSAGNKVFRTTTGNSNPATWTNVSGTLPNVPVNCIAVDASNNAYIGTDIGVYYRGSTMTNWMPFYNFLPRVPVTSLILNETAGVIKAVTFGHGVWESPVYSACPANITLSGTQTGYKVYEAGTSLSSSADIFGGDNTEVFYKSGSRVELTPGFLARAGNSAFKAYIGPCGNGIPTLDSTSAESNTQGQGRQRDTNFPFGRIDQTPLPGKSNLLKVHVPVQGVYKVWAADEQGELMAGFEIIQNLNQGENSISLPSKPKGVFYLKLMFGDTLCDTKEW